MCRPTFELSCIFVKRITQKSISPSKLEMAWLLAQKEKHEQATDDGVDNVILNAIDGSMMSTHLPLNH